MGGCKQMKPRIRSSVGVVINNDFTEFFKGNTRKSVVLRIKSHVAHILCELDGKKTMDELYSEYEMDLETKRMFEKLINFLIKKCIIYDQEKRIETFERKKYSRIFSMLEDYSCNESEILKSWYNIKTSNVCIIGVGAVGSWIAANLVQSGVKNLTLIDGDDVEITNLHRQWGYGENNVGDKKILVLSNRLKEMDSSVNIKEICHYIDEDSLENLGLNNISLMIDCADKPTVDQTAVWVGEYCMKRSIPHIIAGGYNMHISLIGQTIIPYKTACVKCFEKQLKEHNELELSHMKKLATSGRKIGSIGPMCTISASFAALEAVKILSNLMQPVNINRRGEFNIYNMDINYHEYHRIEECEWCGRNGKYRE